MIHIETVSEETSDPEPGDNSLEVHPEDDSQSEASTEFGNIEEREVSRLRSSINVTNTMDQTRVLQGTSDCRLITASATRCEFGKCLAEGESDTSVFGTGWFLFY